MRAVFRVVLGDLRLDVGDARGALFQRVSSSARHQAVGGIGGVVLAEGTLGGVAGRLEIAQERLADPKGLVPDSETLFPSTT